MYDCTLNDSIFKDKEPSNLLVLDTLKELMETSTAKHLLFEGKLGELCKFLKDGLCGALKELLLDMKHSGELDKLITDMILEKLGYVDQKTASYVTPQMFGAMVNGIVDDGAAIRDALTYMAKHGIHTLYFPAGTYITREDIEIPSGVTLRGDGFSSIIKREGTDKEKYNVLLCNECDTVTIENLCVQGERDAHLGTEGEWGMCIGLYGCSDITIRNCKLIDGWGDGVYVGAGGAGCENITVEGCTIDNNRRNGVAVVECDGFRLLNSTVSNTKGTAPQAGIDFEPNTAEQYVKNAVIQNCVFFGNVIDIAFYDRNAADVTVQNCQMNSKYGVMYDSTVMGTKAEGDGVLIQHCSFNNSDYCYLTNRKHINSVPVRLVDCVLAADKPVIQIGASSINYENKMGDIHFINCYVARCGYEGAWFRYINTASSYPLENVTLDVRLGNVGSNSIYCSTSKCQIDACIKCKPRVYTGSALGLSSQNVEPLICVDTRDTACLVNLSHNIPFGVPFTIRKLYGDRTITVENTAEKFGQFGGAKVFSFSGRFDEVTIVHEDAGVWRVIDNTADGIIL